MNHHSKAITGVILGVILSVIFSINLYAQEQKGYEITGHIRDIPDGEKVKMKLRIGMDYANDFTAGEDSAYVKNGQFHLKGVVPEGPRYYRMIFEKTHHHIELFINNNERITINSVPKQIDRDTTQGWTNLTQSVVVEGSASDYAYNSEIAALHTLSQDKSRIEKYLAKISDSLGVGNPAIEALILTKQAVIKNFALYVLTDADRTKVTQRVIVPFFAYHNNRAGRLEHGRFLLDVYNQLTPSEKESYYGEKLKEELPLCVGQSFPEFVLPTVQGMQIALKDITSKSKMVLVHIWSRDSEGREQKEILINKLYKKYHDKGMNVIGLSAETDKYMLEAFLKGHPEQNAWYNVSDFKGFQKGSIIHDVYIASDIHDKACPITEVLLDAEGKIMAWNPTDIELQWYLLKKLGN